MRYILELIRSLSSTLPRTATHQPICRHQSLGTETFFGFRASDQPTPSLDEHRKWLHRGNQRLLGFSSSPTMPWSKAYLLTRFAKSWCWREPRPGSSILFWPIHPPLKLSRARLAPPLSGDSCRRGRHRKLSRDACGVRRLLGRHCVVYLFVFVFIFQSGADFTGKKEEAG